MGALLDLITLLAFLCVLLAFYGFLGLNKRRNLAALAAKRLQSLNPGRGDIAATEIESILRDITSPPLAQVPLLGPVAKWVWLSLALVGWRSSLPVRLALTAMGGTLLGIMVGGKTPMPFLASVVLSVTFSLLLFYGLLRHALSKHHKELLHSLPEAIDAINRTCRAGVPVSNAFILIADNLKGTLAMEFRLIDHWLRLGVPLRRVMQDSARRVPLPEYRFFAVILIINQESGGRLGETLDRLAHTLRERQELQMKIMAKTSEARASAKIVAALVPGMMLYMYFNAPGDFRFLFSDPTGTKVLVYIVASVSLGLGIIQAMVRRVR